MELGLGSDLSCLPSAALPCLYKKKQTKFCYKLRVLFLIYNRRKRILPWLHQCLPWESRDSLGHDHITQSSLPPEDSSWGFVWTGWSNWISLTCHKHPACWAGTKWIMQQGAALCQANRLESSSAHKQLSGAQAQHRIYCSCWIANHMAQNQQRHDGLGLFFVVVHHEKTFKRMENYRNLPASLLRLLNSE